MKLKTYFRYLAQLEDLITQLATVSMVACVMWGVLTRYITEQPAVWTSELSGILFTWIVFIGAASAFRQDKHISVPMLVDALGLKLQHAIKIASDIFVLAFVCFVAYLSYHMMIKGMSRPSPVLRIPFFYVYLAPFIAFILMAINSMARLWLLYTGDE